MQQVRGSIGLELHVPKANSHSLTSWRSRPCLARPAPTSLVASKARSCCTRLAGQAAGFTEQSRDLDLPVCKRGLLP